MKKIKTDEIQNLENKNRQLMEQVGNLNYALVKSEARNKDLEEEIQLEKKKRDILLERYISMMERMVGINEQRAD